MDKAIEGCVHDEGKPRRRRKRKRRIRQGRVILPDGGTLQMRLQNALGFADHEAHEPRHRGRAPAGNRVMSAELDHHKRGQRRRRHRKLPSQSLPAAALRGIGYAAFVVVAIVLLCIALVLALLVLSGMPLFGILNNN